ncbi:MAG: leucine--tRNA ligase [Phycisphaerae bacterium]
MAGYDHIAIEPKWQQFWQQHGVYAAVRDPAKPKFYALDMFPYPSGEGLHVGHPEGYTASDIVSRYKRAKGFAVMHPMGWDAFGLPAEQYAIKNNTHPRVTTQKNIARFRKQLQNLGFSYDWAREVDTTDPKYFRWTQWIFLTLFNTWFDTAANRGRPIAELIAEFRSGQRPLPANAGATTWDALTPTQQRQLLADYRLAYQSDVAVNWCQSLGTVLANEEVIDGKSEVGGFPVERRPMRQWMLRITAYAQRLVDGLKDLQWSDSLKEMQRNWVGRSEGAEVTFAVDNGASLTVFTTRPDTLYGATYMVIAPEHPLAQNVPAAQRAAVAAYAAMAAGRSERQRQEDTRKTGEFTGLYAINPVNNAKLPIYVSDYVLMSYGTGAIMAVPAHDERDFEFATVFKLPIIQVVAPADGKPWDGKAALAADGVAINSPWIEGLGTEAAQIKMIDLLEERGIGKRRVNFKIRDWLFSRQRYWGEPFPLVHLEDGTTVALAPDQLPLELPELEDFKPTGTIDPPLSKAPHWHQVHVVLESDHGNAVARVVPAGTPGAVAARRELNTMPQWAGSCWYYLRYLDADNDQNFISPEAERFWMGNTGVDLYIGGVEHAVLHLLYSRFWHQVLFDRGLVQSHEPFRRLVNQGLILGEAEYTLFSTEAGEAVSLEQVDSQWNTRVVDGRLQTISQHLATGALLVGRAVDVTEVEKKGEGFVLRANPAIRVDGRAFKMSKSRGNVVNPDDVVRNYGADSLRLFEMFMGPLEQVKPWSTAGVEGVYRFLQRIWRNLIDTEEPDPTLAIKVVHQGPDGQWYNGSGVLPAAAQAQAAADAEAIQRPLHRVIRKVGDDIERLGFNTAISAMMEFNNALAKLTYIPQDVAVTLLRILEPFAPHFAEEVYHRLVPVGYRSITEMPWPLFDPAMCLDREIELPVSINGKLRARIKVPADAEDAVVLAQALAEPEVLKHLAGQPPKRTIVVKGKMVNLVV